MKITQATRIGDCLGALGEVLLSSDAAEDALVLSLTCDTRTLTPGALFFCKGAHFRPEYAVEARRKGAAAYVSETRYDCGLPCLLVRDVREAMVRLSLLFYRDAPSRLTTVGITGTKGKSTAVCCIRSILDRALDGGCAILSTIENYDGLTREDSHLTTPEILDLHRHFANAADAGLTHLVMEVSSQALKVGRVKGVPFAIGVFHNLGTDHISPVEHPDFEDYYTSKLKLFAQCRKALVNTDALCAPRTLETARNCGCTVVTYGKSAENDYSVSHITPVPGGFAFTLRSPRGLRRLTLPMHGEFNVENALAACAVCGELGVSFEAMEEGLKNVRVPGRMEEFTSADGQVTVIVDYAHNGMSFEALFGAADREFPGREKVAVFGAPGGKAQGRRAEMGACAGRWCSRVLITEDDPGEERVPDIAAEIEQAARAAGNARIEVCADRTEAIRRAVTEGEGTRVVLLMGKGRETTMKRGLSLVPVPSDTENAERFLREYDAAHAVVTE